MIVMSKHYLDATTVPKSDSLEGKLSFFVHSELFLHSFTYTEYEDSGDMGKNEFLFLVY